jgi:hypothetical protein
MKKYTAYTVIILFLTAISLIGAIGSLIFATSMGIFALAFSPATTIIGFVLIILFIFIGMAFYIKLFKIRDDCIRWTHIFFAYLLLCVSIQFMTGVIGNVSEYNDYKSNSIGGVNYINYDENVFHSNITTSIIIYVVQLIVLILVWITFTKHLKNAKEKRLMDFS